MTTRRAIFAAILTTAIACRLAFAFLTPIFYAPDEHSHFNYVRYLSEHGSFPVQTSKMGDPSHEWEYFQPPLYYVALVPVYRVCNALFHSQATTAVGLRLVSIVLLLVNMGFGVLWLRRLQLKDELLRGTAFCLVCLLPTYVFISSVINNDNLLATLGGAVVCLLARPEQSLKVSAAVGVIFGLALLTKQSAVVLAPAIVLLPMIEWWHQRIKLGAVLSRAGIPLVLAALIFSPWALRNWRVYGTLSPENLSATPISWPSPIYGLASAAHNLVKSFWAVSGIANDVGYPLSAVGMIFMVLACVALVRGREKFQCDVLSHPQRGALLIALLIAILINLILVLHFGYQTGMGQGRHLLALLHPIVLVLAFGSCLLPFQNRIARVAGFWIIYAVGFVIFSLWRFP